MKSRFIIFSFSIAMLSACFDDVNSSSNFVSTAIVVEQRVQPADTGPNVDRAIPEDEYHHVALPSDSINRKSILVVYMVGSLGTPNNSLEIARFIATLGYGVLNLQYPNTTVVGVTCMEQDRCYGEVRGETVFGENVSYAPGLRSYDTALNQITIENSVVGRVLSLLDYLSQQQVSASNPDPEYWKQFVRQDVSSPYISETFGAAYPAWSKIVIAGHSQGGGMAPMLAMNLTAQEPARRVVLLSAPNDNTGKSNGNQSAEWITQSSATALDRFWGIRHIEDTGLGEFAGMNWENLGGIASGGVGGSGNSLEVHIGDGSGSPNGAQRLVVTEPVGSARDAHASIANPGYLSGIFEAWRYVFTANGAD